MPFQELDQLLSLQDIEVTFGPKHPDNPRQELLDILSEITNRNPFLRRDKFYIDFLEIAGGLVINTSQKSNEAEYYFACLYELDGILDDESISEVTEDGFFVIGEFCFNRMLTNNSLEEVTDAYGFDATGYREFGIYQSTYIREKKIIDFKLKYSDFREFVKDIVINKGIVRSV